MKTIKRILLRFNLWKWRRKMRKSYLSDDAVSGICVQSFGHGSSYENLFYLDYLYKIRSVGQPITNFGTLYVSDKSTQRGEIDE